MANKFQKSVLERLEQEAVRQKQKSRETSNQHPKEKDVVEKEEAIPVSARTADIAQDVRQPEPEENPAHPDISVYLIQEHQRLAKNKTFYLDGDVIDAVKAVARRQSITDSKLVNDILRRVLGLELK